ncbi:patched family protein, partial [Cooperia oncophora]
MIGDFATTRHSIGMEAVQFWMNDMESYYHDTLDMKIIDGAFYSMLRHWLASKHNNPWAEDLYWSEEENGSVTLKSFRFLLGMRDISSTTDQMDATLMFRESFNITTFMPLWLFTDQYAIIIPNTVQNIIIALSCMIIIAFVLIPQPMCAFWVALACGSIDFGVVGYMTLWGVNLDAISMITIIMSIGFSVDYSAHITYGYVVSEALVPRDKVRDALASLGWPLCQGALSTIIAVSVLADVPAYMIVTFFKTVFLSISIGLLHGLVFLPVSTVLSSE